jgi:aarF domain-containing kinase
VSDEHKLPGRWKRTIKTAALGGAVGARWAGGKAADLLRGAEGRDAAAMARNIDAAKRMVTTMGELRGPIMKVGQLLSTHAHVLPSEMKALLRPLEEQVPPMPFSVVKRVVERELGEELSVLFSEFGVTAVAAASLGQVHRARLPDGTAVAVKVQYPGAAESVDGDVRNLNAGAALTKKVFADLLGKDKFDVTPFAEEFAEHLAQETDYCREAYNAKLLGRLFESYPQGDLVVPRVFDSHSGLRVITYEWMEGESIGDALSSGDAEKSRRVAMALVHGFWHQLYRGGVLHADPHPGNYRVLADGRVALLDYGCVKVFSEQFMREFVGMAKASRDHDEAAMRTHLLRMGLVSGPDAEEEFDEMGRISRFMSVGIAHEGEFDFGEYDYGKEGKELILFFAKKRSVPRAHRDFLFLTRVVLGHYEYLSRAKARFNFRELVTPYLEAGWQGRAMEVPTYG